MFQIWGWYLKKFAFVSAQYHSSPLGDPYKGGLHFQNMAFEWSETVFPNFSQYLWRRHHIQSIKVHASHMLVTCTACSIYRITEHRLIGCVLWLTDVHNEFICLHPHSSRIAPCCINAAEIRDDWCRFCREQWHHSSAVQADGAGVRFPSTSGSVSSMVHSAMKTHPETADAPRMSPLNTDVLSSILQVRACWVLHRLTVRRTKGQGLICTGSGTSFCWIPLLTRPMKDVYHL